MLICRNAVGVHAHLLETEGVHGKRKVGNPCSIEYRGFVCLVNYFIHLLLTTKTWFVTHCNCMKSSKEARWNVCNPRRARGMYQIPCSCLTVKLITSDCLLHTRVAYPTVFFLYFLTQICAFLLLNFNGVYTHFAPIQVLLHPGYQLRDVPA